jgi:hypothetical protein
MSTDTPDKSASRDEPIRNVPFDEVVEYYYDVLDIGTWTDEVAPDEADFLESLAFRLSGAVDITVEEYRCTGPDNTDPDTIPLRDLDRSIITAAHDIEKFKNWQAPLPMFKHHDAQDVVTQLHDEYGYAIEFHDPRRKGTPSFY